jgi:hypothetical protein
VARWDRCYNIAELREAARRRLPKWIFEFVDLGSEDFVALASKSNAAPTPISAAELGKLNEAEWQGVADSIKRTGISPQ